MNILLVEDEPLVAEDMRNKLIQLGYTKVSVIDTVSDAKQMIESASIPFTFALVDIELIGPLDGIDLGAFLSKKGIPFVYLSNLQDIKTFERAKKTNPQNNIPKPISLLHLRNCLLEVPSTPIIPESKSPYFTITHAGKKYVIDKTDIILLTAAGNNCDVYTKEKKYVSSLPFGHVLKALNDPRFLQVHRSSAININYVNYYDGNQIYLRGMDKQPVLMSIKYRSIFVQQFEMI